MQQKQQRPVRHAGQAGAETSGESTLLVLVGDRLLLGVPGHPERRVGQQEVEVLGAEAVVGEGVAEVDVVDVLALDDHVGLAHRIGARVDVLAVEHRAGLGVHLDQVVVGGGEHAAGPGSGVVDGAHGARLGQRVVLGVEQDVHHQRDDFAGGEVITGLGVVGLGELADEFFEDVAHVVAR